MREPSQREWVLICILASVIAFGVGYSTGWITALNWSVGKALWLLEMKGITVELDAHEIATGLWQYKNNVGYVIGEMNLTN